MPSDPIRILFVDDDVVTGRVMKRNCDNARYQCSVFQSGDACLEAFRRDGADLVVTDLRMPGMSGFDLLTELRTIDQDVPVLVMTGYSSVENAVEAMKRGATDFIKKPFEFEELRLLITRILRTVRLNTENRLLRRRLDEARHRFGMIGETPAMKRLYATVEKLAEVNCTVVISGESGTGKELVARALHDYSPRRAAPFVAVDCGALSETLLESELFGHEKGAFTGATQRRPGLMEQADGGTLFLDEICNISDAMQVKLMRAIDQQRVQRLGSTSSASVDIRVIVATNRDLRKMVEQGELRDDFYHRLNVINVQVPSLRERREDIPALVEHFVAEFAECYGRQVQGFDRESMRSLCEFTWSGNVRELRNTIERCVILADGPRLTWHSQEAENGSENSLLRFSAQEFVSLEELEYEYIRHVLQCLGGKKTKAAQVLGIDKTTLWRKLRRYEGEPSSMV